MADSANLATRHAELDRLIAECKAAVSTTARLAVDHEEPRLFDIAVKAGRSPTSGISPSCLFQMQ